QAGQDKSDRAFAEKIGDGRFDEERLVKDNASDELLGNVNEVLESVLDAIHDGDGVGVPALLQDWQIYRRLAVHPNDVGLNGVSIHGFADIADENGGLADCFQRHAVDELCGGRLAVGVQVVIDGTDLNVAGGENEVALVDGAHHVHGA